MVASAGARVRLALSWMPVLACCSLHALTASREVNSRPLRRALSGVLIIMEASDSVLVSWFCRECDSISLLRSKKNSLIATALLLMRGNELETGVLQLPKSRSPQTILASTYGSCQSNSVVKKPSQSPHFRQLQLDWKQRSRPYNHK